MSLGSASYSKVIDTGVDETSCFFADDESGEEVAHGHYFEEWGITVDLDAYASSWTSTEYSSRPSQLGGAGPLDHAGQSSSYYSYSTYQVEEVFEGGDFTVYGDRRKVRAQGPSLHCLLGYYGRLCMLHLQPVRCFRDASYGVPGEHIELRLFTFDAGGRLVMLGRRRITTFMIQLE